MWKFVPIHYLKRFVLRSCLAVIAGATLVRGATYLYGHAHTWTSVESVQPRRMVIVFGAGVRNGLPTAMLYDRVATAVDLYNAGKVHTLLMSGENAGPQHDETAVMRQTALQLGVPEQDILVDGGGLSTFDTCVRARDLLALQGEPVTLVTQSFHLDRSLSLCNAVGVPAWGFAADRRGYASLWFNQVREIPATIKAAWDILIWKI